MRRCRRCPRPHGNCTALCTLHFAGSCVCGTLKAPMSPRATTLKPPHVVLVPVVEVGVARQAQLLRRGKEGRVQLVVGVPAPVGGWVGGWRGPMSFVCSVGSWLLAGADCAAPLHPFQQPQRQMRCTPAAAATACAGEYGWHCAPCCLCDHSARSAPGVLHPHVALLAVVLASLCR